MNLGDPDLELIDPTPNVHSLFLHFDKVFFSTTLASRAVVRWSKRMYTCAGICSYEGRGGVCDIALSEPLLKLRTRKDLVETLLHEMIHAYLFITCRVQDRDGHGPSFQSHMHRINHFAKLNITIYHDFHDEVKLYQTHWWRCNGPCQSQRPHFGIVRRTMNRAPGPSDYWWREHQFKCGGVFVKIKEPEKTGKKAPAAKPVVNSITKYINNNNESILNKNIQSIPKAIPVNKDASHVPPKPNPKPKTNGIATIVSTKRDNIVFNPKPPSSQPFTGTGKTIDGPRNRTQSASAADTVRNVWANKQLPTTNANKLQSPVRSNTKHMPNVNPNKRISTEVIPPPKKVMKIDDYFKDKASSILKDVYGQDFKVTQAKDSNKLEAIVIKNCVNCPVCNARIADDVINRHLDECLNKEVIEKLSKESIPINTSSETPQTTNSKPIVKQTPPSQYIEIPEVSKFKLENPDIKLEVPESIDLSFMDELTGIKPDKDKIKTEKESNHAFKPYLTTEVNKAYPPSTKPIDVNKYTNTIVSINTLRGEQTDGDKKMVTDFMNGSGWNCPCCNMKVLKPIAEHLEECLKFFGNDKTIPVEGASTSLDDAIIIDDEDDIFDETMTMNPTGTKTPCPCCLQMVELDNMNDHLDECLQ